MGSATSQLILGMVLRFTDQGSGAATKALDGVQRTLDAVRKGGSGAAGAIVSAASKLRDVAQSGQQASTTADAAARSLERVNKSSSGAAQATNDVAKGAGSAASALERIASSRAAEGAAKVSKEATGATAALDKMRQAADGIKGGLQGYLSGIAAYTAGKAVLSGPVRETMGYERQLANVALTAAPKGATVDQLKALQKQLDAGIMAAIRPSEGGGGGSRDSAMEGLNALIASGKYKDVGAALKDLKWVQKGATAFAAQPLDIANTIIAGQNMGVSAQRTLEIVGASGKDGAFETRNMAKHLPTWLPYAQSYGMKGEQGLIEIVTAAQAAMQSAGTADEAGTNVKNGLQKLLANDTVQDAKKLGIDLRGSIAQAVSKGVSPADAFGNLLEQQMVKNPNYQKTIKQLQTAKGAEKQQSLEAMATIFKGAGFSSIVQDMQASSFWSSFLAQRHAKENSTMDLRGNAKKSGGLVDENMAYVKTLPSFDAEVLAAEKANAMQTAMDKVNPLLGSMADWLSGMAKDYPTMAAATWGATTALTALAAAAGAASLAQMLGGGGAGAAGGMAKAIFSRLGLGAMGLAGAGTVGLVGAGAYGVGSVINSSIEGTAVHDKLGELVTEFMAFFGNQNAQDALAATRQADAAQALKEAAEALKNARPRVYLEGRQLDAEIQSFQTFEARRR
jgi:hypothetical protein